MIAKIPLAKAPISLYIDVHILPLANIACF